MCLAMLVIIQNDNRSEENSLKTDEVTSHNPKSDNTLDKSSQLALNMGNKNCDILEMLMMKK